MARQHVSDERQATHPTIHHCQASISRKILTLLPLHRSANATRPPGIGIRHALNLSRTRKPCNPERPSKDALRKKSGAVQTSPLDKLRDGEWATPASTRTNALPQAGICGKILRKCAQRAQCLLPGMIHSFERRAPA
eukprot:2658592-Pyramimonas_sp.AAC.1